MTDVERFQQIVARRLGLRVEARDAERALTNAYQRSTSATTAWVERLDREPAALHALAPDVTVGETYFFRHLEQLSAFVDVALADRLAATAGPVRVLSAGCATGEEPYTLAMLVRERWPEAARRVEIVGVDVNEVSLERARRGVYARWALRTTPPASERRWFVTQGRDARVIDEIREAVRFEQRNLHDAGALWAAGRWDAVLCRNVLMYFVDEAAASVLDNIAESLVAGGYLFVGHAETVRARLQLREGKGTFFWQKASSEPGPKPEPEPEPVNVLVDAPTVDVPAVVDSDAELRARARSHYLLALTRESADDLIGALHHIELSLSFDSTFALARMRLGALARRAGDLHRARHELSHALTALASSEATTADDLVVYGGGLGRAGLVELCRRELAACEVSR